MKSLQFAGTGDRLSVLCLGAHSDDIEIGVGRNSVDHDRHAASGWMFSGAF